MFTTQKVKGPSRWSAIGSLTIAALAAACGGGDAKDLFGAGQGTGAAPSDGGTGGAEPTGGAGGSTTGGTGGRPTGGMGGATGGVGGTSTGGTGGTPTGGTGGAIGGAGGTSSGGVGGTSTGGTGSGGVGGSGGGACAADPTPPVSGGSCVAVGSSGYTCNPITNAGCNVAAGEACDFTGTAFDCFPGSNVTLACGACDNSAGPFCVPGFTCFNGRGACTRYCCSDSDCAPGKPCIMQPPTSLGVCQAASSTELAGFGSSGTGGTGGGTGGAGGSCAHSPCVEGGPLDMFTCADQCVMLICALYQTCCTSAWDSSCVSAASQLCGCT